MPGKIASKKTRRFIMDEFLKVFTDYPANRTIFTFWDGIINIFGPALFASLLVYVYNKTHKGLGYSVSFLKTLIILSITSSILMMVIGSNIARAFSLVGALSIIRFRTAIKDPLDVGYIFAAIAIGMSCGTGFYVIGGTLAVGVSAVILILDKFNFAGSATDSIIMHLSSTDSKPENEILDSLKSHFVEIASISSEKNSSTGKIDRSYITRPNRNFNEQELLESVNTVCGSDTDVSLVYQTEGTPF